MARLHVIGGRRLKALAVLLIAWALLLLGLASRPSARARAMRAGALGVMWAPVVVLIPAAIEPSAPVEYATIALGCLAAGALTDLLTPWPRAVIPPAVVSIVLLALDALSGRQLLMRSVLGPNPILGARFYGIGNEHKSGLAVLVLAAVAAALYPAVRRSRAALAVVGAGLLLAVVEGSARIGAGVGGVILVSAGFAVAAVLLLPGAVSRRRALAVILAPIAGLVVLAALDLLTAHGGGHFTGSILHARSAGDLRDVIVRRYGAAWRELKNHAMPFATVLALACGGLGVRMRDRLLAPVHRDPGWLAGARRRARRGGRGSALRGLGSGAARRGRVRPRVRGELSVGWRAREPSGPHARRRHRRSAVDQITVLTSIFSSFVSSPLSIRPDHMFGPPDSEVSNTSAGWPSNFSGFCLPLL